MIVAFLLPGRDSRTMVSEVCRLCAGRFSVRCDGNCGVKDKIT